MSRYSWRVGMLAAVLALGSGCCCVQNRHQGCVDSCGPNLNDPILGDCNKCGVCGGEDCPGYTPCGYMKYMLTCGAGCSEIYWGEWISDPPDCCDPCDNCGNWTGPNCCRRQPVLNTLKALWGTRYFGGCCSTCGDVGCGGCSDGGGHSNRGRHTLLRGHVLPSPEDEFETLDGEPEVLAPAQRAAPAAPAKAPEPKAAMPRSTRTTQAPSKSSSSVRNASTAKYPWQPR